MRRTNSHIKPALKGDSSRARPVGDAARGESGGLGSIASGSEASRPYSNQRCGCEQSEQTEGLNRGCACLRQPLSQSASRRIASSPAGEPFGAPYNLTRSHAFGVFHMAKPYFTAHQRNFTLRKQDFTADESPLYPIPTTSAPIFSINARSCSAISMVGRFFFISSSSCIRLSRSM